MNKTFLKLGLLPISLCAALPAFSATTIDLSQQPVSILTSLFPSVASSAPSAMKIEEVNRAIDFNQTLHVRVKEMYQGYPVWGGDGVVHIPNGDKKLSLMSAVTPAASMNGKMYQHLDVDLANTPAYVFDTAQAQKAIQQTVMSYQQKIGAKPEVKNQQAYLIVYIDKNNKAHWAFKVSFDAPPIKVNALPEKPVYIVDALSFQVYTQWNDIKTLSDVTLGGGFGGNKKMGEMVYDGLSSHLPKLTIERDAASKTCYLENADVTVIHDGSREVMKFSCEQASSDHNNIYWDASFDSIHGAYSPSNDALYDGAVIKNLYQDWYKVPVLESDGKPMMLTMVVHSNMDNAYWDGKEMTFGDGIIMFYPLTSLGVGAHEISHGFTEQHSNLTYEGQSGGMNEAFSDMAAQAAEYYAYGKNSWEIGPEIVWWGDALRYLDQPSKDCNWWTPRGSCSIDSASQYYDGLDVHFSSGVYNRAFYLIGTAPGWDTRKAFNVFVQANMHYWTSNVTFSEGACGVIKATKDYGYDTSAVLNAFKLVGVDTGNC